MAKFRALVALIIVIGLVVWDDSQNGGYYASSVNAYVGTYIDEVVRLAGV